jgi:hypothetical protein
MNMSSHSHRAAFVAALSLLLSGHAFGQASSPALASSRIAAEDQLYASARRLIDDGRFKEALVRLDEMLAQLQTNAKATAKNKADAAFYWKAYALAKQGEAADAMAAIADMERKFPASDWVKDAKALELELRQATGQSVSPESQPDEELKLLALRGLMQNDPERALPMVAQILSGSSSVRVKENALFLLSQSRSPEARKTIGDIASGTSNPELQLRAIRYLGVMGNADSRRLLSEIYSRTSDAGVKHAVLRSLMVGGAADELISIARTESDPSLQADAVRTLGLTRGEQTAAALRSIYTSAGVGAATKRAVIQALFLQRNAAALVELARSESDPDLKMAIVKQLAAMKAPEATDYLAELLK